MRFDGTRLHIHIHSLSAACPATGFIATCEVFDGKLYVDVVEEEINRFTTAFAGVRWHGLLN